MNVTAIVRLNVPTSVVDQAGSIVAAVSDLLIVDESDCVDLDDWTWHYESTAEYAWANALTRQPLTGEPWADDPAPSDPTGDDR